MAQILSICTSQKSYRSFGFYLLSSVRVFKNRTCLLFIIIIIITQLQHYILSQQVVQLTSVSAWIVFISISRFSVPTQMTWPSFKKSLSLYVGKSLARSFSLAWRATVEPYTTATTSNSFPAVILRRRRSGITRIIKEINYLFTVTNTTFECVSELVEFNVPLNIQQMISKMSLYS